MWNLSYIFCRKVKQALSAISASNSFVIALIVLVCTEMASRARFTFLAEFTILCPGTLSSLVMTRAQSLFPPWWQPQLLQEKSQDGGRSIQNSELRKNPWQVSGLTNSILPNWPLKSRYVLFNTQPQFTTLNLRMFFKIGSKHVFSFKILKRVLQDG